MIITILFAPTSLTLTTDSSLPLSTILKPYHPNSLAGNRMEIILPEQMIVISNHQAKTDWIYLWLLFHFSTTPSTPETTSSTARGGKRGHAVRSLVILLMASLRKIPVLGEGMARINFIFLSRTWSLDRAPLTRSLLRLGAKAQERGGVNVLLFPEGTILSDEERERSRAYAGKTGVQDFRNLLLPRSTGLLHCLRTLLPEVPDLKILDVTIGYPGVPSGGFAQEWYTPFSVYLRGVPPPTVHMHLRLINPLAPVLPGLSDLCPASPASIPSSPSLSTASPTSSDTEKSPQATEVQAREFGGWLRGVWEGKEELMDRFARDGGFGGDRGEGVMPIRF